MTQEDKDLLLRDLCCRLPYGVIVEDRNGTHTLTTGNTEITALFGDSGWHNIKPYLRPMSSMTEQEKSDYFDCGTCCDPKNETYMEVSTRMAEERTKWLDEHMFDHRNLIPRGLALCKTDK